MIHYMTSNGIGNAWVGNELRILKRERIPFRLHSLHQAQSTFFQAADIDELGLTPEVAW